MYIISLIFAFAGMPLWIIAFSHQSVPLQMKDTIGLFHGLKDLMSDMQVYLMILLLTKRSLKLIQSIGNSSFQKYISVTSHLIGQTFAM